MAIILNCLCTPCVGCRAWKLSRTIPYDLYTILTRLCPLVECTSRTVVYSYGLTRCLSLVRPLIRSHTDVTLVTVFLSVNNLVRLTLEWPECNAVQVTVGSVVCTVYTSGQPC